MRTDNQQKIVDRIAALLKSRNDVDALWLSGSLGAGEGDEWSDVDFLVLVPQNKIAALPEALKTQMREAFQTVLSSDIFGRVLNFITPDWTRFDLNLVTPSELARFDASVLKPLFNKGENAPPVQPRADYAPAPTTIEKLSTEFLRVLGLSAVGLGRREYDVMLNGIDLLRRMTIDLMLEENAVSPSKRGGVLKRNPFLTPEQRADLVSVPAAGADGTGIVAALEAIARIFLARAKALCTRTGAAWPDAFERATRAHLKKSGMEI